MTMPTDHLGWIELRLSHERNRLAQAKTEREREMRRVWVAQIEKELAHELAFLSRSPIDDMTDDELLAELSA